MAGFGGGQKAETHGNFSNAVNVDGDGNTVSIEAPVLDYNALAKALLEQSKLALGGPPADLGAAIAKVAMGAAAGDDRLEQALKLLQAKKPEQAEPLVLSVAQEKAERIAQDSKDAAEAYRVLAAIASVSNPGRAQEAYEKALSYDPGDLRSAMMAGWIAMGRGQMQHAADLFRLVQQKSSSGVQLFWTHMGFADFYEWRGDGARAVGACVQAVKVAQAIRAKFPDDLTARRKLRLALGRYGDAVKRRGGTDAVDWYLRAAALFDSTAVDVAGNEVEACDFALLANQIGQAWLERGDEPGALNSHGAALKIWSDLAAAEPKNVYYRRNIMITRSLLGNLYAGKQDWQSANQQYQAAIHIVAELASADPEDKEAARDLGNLDVKVGNVLFAVGMTEQALEAFRAGLSIVQRVAAAEAENCEYQADVARAQVKVGGTAARLGSAEEARSAFEEGARLARGLVARDAKNAGWAALLRASEEGLSHLSP